MSQKSSKRSLAKYLWVKAAFAASSFLTLIWMVCEKCCSWPRIVWGTGRLLAERTMRPASDPGMSPPSIGKTYVLVYNEGLSTERRQRVRIKTADTQVRTYTEIVNNVLIDFQAQVSTCELFDGLLYDYPGSPPMRSASRLAKALPSGMRIGGRSPAL